MRLRHLDLRAAHEVGHGHDPLQLALLVDDGNAADLILPHQLRGSLHRVVGRARHHLGRHAVLDGDAARIPAFRDDVHAEVTIGHDSHDLSALRVVDDRHDAGVLVTHDARSPLRGIRRHATARLLGHGVFDSHDLHLRLLLRPE